jgi:hypothetical protein
MERRNSNNLDILKIETLIRDYINNPHSVNHQQSNAGVELSNLKISGSNLLAVLDNIGFETEEQIEEYKNLKYYYDEKVNEYTKLEESYKKLQENHKKFVNSLETITEDPFIKFIEKASDIIRANDIIKIIKESIKEAKQE